MLASASMNCAGQATQAAPLATLPMDARNASTHRGSDCVPAPAARIDNQDERTQIQAQCREVQAVTGDNISLVYGVLGYNGKQAEQTAAAEGIELQVVSLPQTGKGQTGKGAKRGFVLLPRRWVVERSFAWKSRFRRLARGYERLKATLRAMHFVAFAAPMLAKLFPLAKG